MPRSDTQFKPGNRGRPKGARSRLSESFLKAIADDFDQHGIETLIAMREQRPADYVKVVASLLPKDRRIELDSGNASLVDLLSSIQTDSRVR